MITLRIRHVSWCVAIKAAICHGCPASRYALDAAVYGSSSCGRWSMKVFLNEGTDSGPMIHDLEAAIVLRGTCSEGG